MKGLISRLEFGFVPFVEMLVVFLEVVQNHLGVPKVPKRVYFQNFGISHGFIEVGIARIDAIHDYGIDQSDICPCDLMHGTLIPAVNQDSQAIAAVLAWAVDFSI